MKFILFSLLLQILSSPGFAEENNCVLNLQEGTTYYRPGTSLGENLEDIERDSAFVDSDQECFQRAIDFALEAENSSPTDQFTYVVSWVYVDKGWGALNDSSGRVTGKTKRDNFHTGKNYGLKRKQTLKRVGPVPSPSVPLWKK